MSGLETRMATLGGSGEDGGAAPVARLTKTSACNAVMAEIPGSDLKRCRSPDQGDFFRVNNYPAIAKKRNKEAREERRSQRLHLADWESREEQEGPSFQEFSGKKEPS